ncbi:MAG TPA: glycosyltransferase family 9 protein [Syntrophales bacterium]|nr:glycosyltransferase family 9 protein [Syntrophales bacterium]HON23657.1 glycosyltransferase family 9 protein [Syntrophales bacterium]HOU77841.1 glycosyltransferase family 9 protein [Syntrophales bacterium]HPC32588.1 glycosyltransferase family 9 protein [Syntrophales bacterium]HQG34215.1 glycosyltransferase family 9 protein [Syntrophales bacterium]
MIKNPVKKRLARCIDGLLAGLVSAGRFLGAQYPRCDGLAPEHIENILVVRLDHIGDVIMTTPIFRLLKERYPRGRITCLVGSWGRAVVENNPHLDEILTYDAPWWTKSRPEGNRSGLIAQGRELVHLLADLRRRRFDLLIDPRGDLRHLFLFGYLGRPRYVLSYDRTGGRYLLAAATTFAEASHEIDKGVRLLEHLGIETVKTPPRVEIYPDAARETGVEAFLRERKIQGRPLFIFAPGARKHLKRWPEKNFAALADWLLTRCPQGVVVLAGASWDREVAARITAHSRCPEGIVDIAGRPDIVSLFALMRRSRLIVANDGPIAHMSSALDIPTVVLFGPVQMERFLPRGERSVAIKQPFPCSPCLLEDDRCSVLQAVAVPGACMEAITVAEVQRHIEKLWESDDQDRDGGGDPGVGATLSPGSPGGGGTAATKGGNRRIWEGG